MSRLVSSLAFAGLTAALAVSTASAPAQAAPPSRGPDLGSNVLVFDPSMPVSSIQAQVNAVADRQRDDEMGTGRYALLFEPGTYGTATEPLNVEVGYYTEVAGLGASPADVKINGSVDVFNRCGADGSCTALTNFWRSLSNLTIATTDRGGCRSTTEFWAASQAAPLRRVDVTGGTLSFMDYCSAGPQYASGGFMADSRAGTVVNGSQQQYLVRNSTIGSWSNGVWNQVFSGVEGAPAQSFPDPPYTTLATTPVSKERPFLYRAADGRYRVSVPAVQRNSTGAGWTGGATAGRSIPLTDFYVAKPGDKVSTIDAALNRGKNLLLTPGVYAVDRSIVVRRPGTVVLGLGLPTLTAEKGAVPLVVGNTHGVDVSGLMIDAGAKNSRALLQVGTSDRDTSRGTRASDPTTLHDVFFRIGGPHVGKASVSLLVNSDDVLLDDIWAWRADHGEGVGWTQNTAANGVVVNGDDVNATGLFVEHYQQYNVIWNGERGRTVFFQNELPYDPPNQAAWQHGDSLGWAAYKVSDRVRTHELWGGGSYIFTNVDPTIHASRGFEVPDRPGVKLHDVLTVQLGAGTIDHVVNDVGAPVTGDAVGTPSFVVSYP